MIKLVRKIFIICLIVLLSFLLAGSGMQGYVLCNGEDGHIAIEAEDSICCSETSNCSSQEYSADSAEREISSDNDCGACTDISISIGFVAVSKESSHVNPAFPTSSIISFTTVDNNDFSGYLSVSEFWIPPPYFTPLRSIVLLI